MQLSIITINLNNKSGLEKTIQSVISQTNKAFEFIIIDGNSNDGSVDIIRKYEEHISYWVSETDTGIYSAMNKGIKNATGSYCYFLNSGDIFPSNHVVEDVFTQKQDNSFICGNYIVDSYGNQKKYDDYKDRDWTFSLYDIYSGVLCHQAFFIKKEMFSKYGYYDENLRIASDWKLFFIAIGLNHEPVKYVDTYIVIYNTEGFSSHVGGRAILSEKRKIAQVELSGQVYDTVDRLYYLYRNGFIVDFIHSKKWIHTTFRIIFTVFRKLGITKV